MYQPSLDTIVELNPSARTRLIGSSIKEPDFTLLYITSTLSVVFVCLAGLWLWEYGFVSSPASYTLMGTTIFLLALNATLGWRAKRNLKKVRDLQYAEYVNRLNQMTTHEKLNRHCASPIWIERNTNAI